MGDPRPASCGAAATWLVRPKAERRSYVEEPHVIGVGLDEVLAAFNVVAHQHGEDFVSDGGLFDGDLQQRALVGIHGGLPQFIRVHFAETLQPLELSVWMIFDVFETGDVVLQVDLRPTDLGGVQRWLGDVDVAGLDQRTHLPEEEREQQRTNV